MMMRSNVHALRYLGVWVLAVLLSSCQSAHLGLAQHDDAEGNPRALATTLLNQAEQVEASQRAYLKLQAASHLVRTDTWSFPAELLRRLTPTPETQEATTLVTAQMALLEFQPKRAERLLTSINPTEPELALRQHLLLARAFIAERRIGPALEQYHWLAEHFPSALEQQQAWQQIWLTLLDEPPYRLRHAQNLRPSPWTQAWLSLASLAKKPWPQPQALDRALRAWASEHPDHPGTRIIDQPEQPSPLSGPKRIALLLPLQGPLASAGLAIRDGVMAAYYLDLAKHPGQVIDIYDTTTQDLTTVAERLAQNNTDWVIGPLAKEQVNLWLSLSPDIPTLTLNKGERSTPWALQLTLSPLDSVSQVVHRALRDGHERAWVIHDQSTWGERLSQSFTQTWEAHGGQVMQVTELDERPLTHQIAESLGIDQSQQRLHAWQERLGHKLRTLPHRLYDRDMIFLATTAEHAREVRPLLQYHFAGNIPVYATSSIYSSQASGYHDRDLDGIRFCDAAWVADTLTGRDADNPSLLVLQQRLRQLWPKLFNHQARFFALGIDAFQLIDDVPKMRLLHAPHHGATGRIALGSHGELHRQLRWLKFRQGHPVVQQGLWDSEFHGLELAHLALPSEPLLG